MIKLLDCTLRDGGYINNWSFGHQNILNSVRTLEQSNVNILELGFLKNEDYDEDRTVFNSIKQVEALIPNKKRNIEYAVMIEALRPFPLEMIEERTDAGVDIIRVIVWKTKHDENGNIIDALQSGFEYCKGIVEKGYKLCVQPARVDQYSDDEFIAMLNQFQQLNPMAIYVVDSWGTQSTQQIMHYVKLADKTLERRIAIGYHGHNNLMQAYGTAETFANSGLDRDLIVDASVYGIGRGAGNLNLEIFANYMNEVFGADYDTVQMIAVYQNCIKDIYKQHIWGYSMPYFLTAKYKCNPCWGEYLGILKGLEASEIEMILQELSEDDMVMYSAEKADDYIAKVIGK